MFLGGLAGSLVGVICGLVVVRVILCWIRILVGLLGVFLDLLFIYGLIVLELFDVMLTYWFVGFRV